MFGFIETTIDHEFYCYINDVSHDSLQCHQSHVFPPPPSNIANPRPREQFKDHMQITETKLRDLESLDAIGDWGKSGWASQNRKLSTTASESKLLISHSTVLDESCGLDRVVGTETSSIVLGESPSVGFAVIGDRKSVVNAGGDEDCIDVWKR